MPVWSPGASVSLRTGVSLLPASVSKWNLFWVLHIPQKPQTEHNKNNKWQNCKQRTGVVAAPFVVVVCLEISLKSRSHEEGSVQKK